LSEAAFAEEWTREEEEAWTHLQPDQSSCLQLFEGTAGVLEETPREDIVARIIQLLRSGRW
jgi:hypothetical protein